MGFFSQLANEVAKNVFSSTGDKLRRMANDSRIPADKRMEFLDKAEKADIVSMRARASKINDEEEKGHFIEEETRRIQDRTRRLRENIRWR